MDIPRRIDIARAGKADRYAATHAGAVIVTSSRTPIFDACRVLAQRGLSGRLAVYRPGDPTPAMTVDIEHGAELMIREGVGQGPRIARFHPFDHPEMQD